MKTSSVRTRKLAILAIVFASLAFAQLVGEARSAEDRPIATDTTTDWASHGATAEPTEAMTVDVQFAALPPEFLDPAFGHYVDLTRLADAIRQADPDRLINAALALAEGERILLRTHKSGLTAKALMLKASKLAANDGNQDALKRLAAAARETNDKDFLSHIEATQKLVGTSRATTPIFTVSAGKLLAMKTWLDQSRKATLTGDKELLGMIRMDIEDSDGISGNSRTEFLDQITDFEESIGDATDDDRLMQILTHPSRRTAGRLIYSSTAAEYGYSWTGHAPQSSGEAIVRAHNEIGNRIDTVANISQLSSMTKRNITQNIDTSASYSKIVASGRVKYDKSESGEAFQQWTRNQNYWMVLVKNVRIKPGTWYSRTEKNWKGERTSKAGAIMLYDFAVYGPDLANNEVAVRYTIYNGSDRTVNFRMIPSNRQYSLAAGRTFTGNSVGPGKAPQIQILDTNRTYTLTNGSHKFWWMQREGRIGFDKNYN